MDVDVIYGILQNKSKEDVVWRCLKHPTTTLKVLQKFRLIHTQNATKPACLVVFQASMGMRKRRKPIVSVLCLTVKGWLAWMRFTHELNSRNMSLSSPQKKSEVCSTDNWYLFENALSKSSGIHAYATRIFASDSFLLLLFAPTYMAPTLCAFGKPRLWNTL